MSANWSSSGEPIAQAITQLGINLMQGLIGPDSGQNVVIAPLCVEACLAIAHDGASGHTREVMARCLGLDRRDPDGSIRALTTAWRNLPVPDRLMQLYAANGVWVDAGVAVRPQFLETNRLTFQAEVAQADLRAPGIAAINTWLSRATHGKITRIFDRGDDPGMVALASAAYFKGFWAKGFERRNTEMLPFYLVDGSEKSCPAMTSWGRFSYLVDDTFQAVRLPYLGDQVSMSIFLPNPGVSVSQALDTFTVERMDGWLNALYQWENGANSVHLQLPRFKVECISDLNDALSGAGIGLAFDPVRAEFEGMCPEGEAGLRLGMVRHCASLDVDEDGTEATIATWTGSILDDTPQEIPDVLVERPFLFVIRDDSNGVVLFMGAIFEP